MAQDISQTLYRAILRGFAWHLCGDYCREFENGTTFDSNTHMICFKVKYETIWKCIVAAWLFRLIYILKSKIIEIGRLDDLRIIWNVN